MPAISSITRGFIWIIALLAGFGLTLFLLNYPNSTKSWISKIFRFYVPNYDDSADDHLNAPRQLSVVFITLIIMSVLGAAVASSAPEKTFTVSQASADEVTNEAPITEEAATPTTETPTEDPGEIVPLLAILDRINYTDQTEDSNTERLSIAKTFQVDFNQNRFGFPILIVSSPDNKLSMFHVIESGELSKVGNTVVHHEGGQITDLLIMSNDINLVTGSNQKHLLVWRISDRGISNEPVRKTTTTYPITSLSAHPDGLSIAVGMDHGADEFESLISIRIPSNDEIREKLIFDTKQFSISDMDFNSDGLLISVGTSTQAVLWGQLALNNFFIDSKYHFINSYESRAVAASVQNANTFITSTEDGTVILWSIVPSEQIAISPNLGGPVEGLVFHPSLPIVAVGTSDCYIFILNAVTLQTLLEPSFICIENGETNSESLYSMDFSPNGNYLAVGTSSGVFILNTSEQQLLDITN